MSETKPEDTTDNFERAFDLLAEMGDKPVTVDQLAGVEEVKPAEEVKTEEVVTDPKPAEAVAAEVVTEEKPAEEVKPEPAAAPAPGIQDVLTRLDELKPAAPETPAAQPQPEPAAPLYTQEEQDFIKKYHEDWPDVVKAEALIRRSEYRDLVSFVFQEVAKAIEPLNLTAETVRTLAERTHLGDLRAAATDYDSIRDKVVDWAGKQPAYLRSAYETVIAQGTVDEVKDLITRYRAETGDTGKPAATATTPVTTKKDTELPPATIKAAAAMAPVSSKRSATIQTVDPEDFESAFAEFAEKV